MRDDLRDWLAWLRRAGPLAVLSDLLALAAVVVACLAGTLVLYALVSGS